MIRYAFPTKSLQLLGEQIQSNLHFRYYIKMDLRKIGWDGMYWIDMAQDRDQ
jgi:hypothetical protein